MRRNASTVLTVVLLAAALALVAFAAYLAKSGRSPAGSTGTPDRPAAYAILAGPFDAGIVRGRLVTGTAGAHAATAGFAEPGDGCPTRSAGAEGGVADAVVYVQGVTRGKAPANDELSLELTACGFTPRVAVGLEGGTAWIRARGAGHRLQAFMGGVRVYDSTAGGDAAITLASGGAWTVRCAAGHPREEGWIFATETPYHALTDPRGRFEMAQVPVGRWTLSVWHPVLGETHDEVDVLPGKTADVELRF